MTRFGPRPSGAARLLIAVFLSSWAVQIGCASKDVAVSLHERSIQDAASAFLLLNPEVEWTSAHNKLVEHGKAAIDWLVRRPAMQRTVAPDSLETLLHTSLIRLLAGARAPRLTFCAFETTLDLLYFDPRVNGRPLGEVCIPPGTALVAWHDAYPHRLARELSDCIDAEADRRTTLQWWESVAGTFEPVSRPLFPNSESLWPLLIRRHADVWQYDLDRKAVLVGDGPGRRSANALIEMPTSDYNLVRAACIWLGSRGDDQVQARLIELINHPRPVIAHNALFALRHSPDPRIRETLERFERGGLANTISARR